MEYSITKGDFSKMGVSHKKGGIIFTFEGKKESKCAILLYQVETGNIQKLDVPKEYCIGSLRSVMVRGLDTQNYYYNFEIDGIISVDPYARRIKGRQHWFETTRYTEDYHVWCGFDKEEYSWGDDRAPEILKEDIVLYKLHVRGFTMDGGATGKKRGTFEGIRERLTYLHELGITSIELMPAYEFEEMVMPDLETLPDYLTWKMLEKQNKTKKDNATIVPDTIRRTVEKVNYWGYIPGDYFAPKAAFSSQNDEVKEFKDLIKSMHELSMECIMEIFFDEKMNQSRMLDVLRYWVMQYHVDGFHVIGPNLPLRAMAQDPLLSRTKLFCAGFNQELLDDKIQYPHLYIYNDEYLYPMRKMLNHMDGSMMEFANQQKKQHECYGYVNYAAINNGFTLSDVFAYCEKHNMDNGENNADGLNFNFSNNYGVEGATRKKYICAIRKKQMRNAFAMVLLAQGVPLIASGDEFANSQSGNNNAYCQDNKIGWINWKNEKSNADLVDYIKNLLEFRRKHPVLHQAKPMKQSDYKGYGYPDLSYHRDDAWLVGFEAGRQYAGMLYNGAYACDKNGACDQDIYVAYNFQNGKHFLALPKLPKGQKWYQVMDTSNEQPFLDSGKLVEKQEQVEVPGMTIQILIGK
jgi:glycogen operon protein